ncbi:hypothetical protein E3P89_01070 [Wallemia ichthyophaga]|uniref:Uncharacterized protein n=1 Tax=Wallemia ichthyophaga TaxID=245174 RepID=A0A4T0HM82_WALIC|nr:hypothetical protein E3P95_03552 [Wallemia ichthyophaga]TIA96856.1 hypothetical protein E3P94_03559 [Wallemia ichthyophaga]TIB14257.1 hypothetical protein E3P90_01365 [Wallemia ichthyophaga]TIB16253.1 hypothetical protein E3P93_01116 [Wallemia ichthyophaga]TIB24443.1 hypothetical protein E3P89_01070 [Wallemia ichthyophaga]
MASNAQFEEMVAMMNREREKEKKKLFYAEDQKDQKRIKKYKEKTETVIKNDWGFLVNPKQRKEDATPLASVKYMSKTKL